VSRPEQRTYVVSYDVADDKRRDQLATLLESRGQRVQWSVFEIISTPKGIADLLARATALPCFAPQEDSLRCYPLCRECRTAVQVYGRAPALVNPGQPMVL
jgi:CRISPR-associated protein Cas2